MKPGARAWPAHTKWVAVGAWVAGALVFYRGAVSSGFAQIAGDPGDARFVMAICEHWYMVLEGGRRMA
jgi:hypothetical protein